MAFRDRIVRTELVPATEIKENPKNWRIHTNKQRSSMVEILNKVGNVDFLKVVEDPEGGYILVDGHLRKDIRGDESVQVVVLDLNQEEMDLVLATFDPLGTLADPDQQKLRDLTAELGNLRATNPSLFEMLDDTAGIEPPKPPTAPPPLVDTSAKGGAGGWGIIIDCDNEEEQLTLLEQLLAEGLECRALI